MSDNFLLIIMGGAGGIFVFILLAYYILKSKMQNKETKYIAQLVEGTKEERFNMEIFYQKFYVKCLKIPFVRRYSLKLRRRLEIRNLDDEYLTRKQTAQIMFKAMLIVIPLTFVIILMTKAN